MVPPHRTFTVTNIGGDNEDGPLSLTLSVSGEENGGCPTGLKENGKYCEDVQECELELCEQQCENSFGSYKCSCRQGFTLNENGQNCDG